MGSVTSESGGSLENRSRIRGSCDDVEAETTKGCTQQRVAAPSSRENKK